MPECRLIVCEENIGNFLFKQCALLFDPVHLWFNSDLGNTEDKSKFLWQASIGRHLKHPIIAGFWVRHHLALKLVSRATALRGGIYMVPLVSVSGATGHPMTAEIW